MVNAQRMWVGRDLSVLTDVFLSAGWGSERGGAEEKAQSDTGVDEEWLMVRTSVYIYTNTPLLVVATYQCIDKYTSPTTTHTFASA